MASRLWSVVFDANDRVALARFWAAALDWHYGEEEEGATVHRRVPFESGC